MNHNSKRMVIVFFIGGLTVLLIAVYGSAQKAPFADFCAGSFKESGICPPKICRLQSAAGDMTDVPQGEKKCMPVPCPDIPAADCPEEFCAVMVDCSDQKICHYQMSGDKTECGDVAYAGQDVDCCPGLVRRCGYEFIDGTCDMQGQGSVYNLPICIPCGNGICDNFEDRCNCPEDCGKAPQHGGTMRDLPFVYIKPAEQKK